MYFAIAEWRHLDVGPRGWNPPMGASVALNFESITHKQNRIAPWPSLFAYDSDPSGQPGVVVIGDDPAKRLTVADKTALSALVGGATIDAARLDDALLEMLSRHAVVDGSTGVRPLSPTRAGNIEVAFGPLLKRAPFEIDNPDQALILGKIRQDYAERRAVCRTIYQEGDPRRLGYRKFLGALCRKYGTTDYRKFQGSLPDEEPIEPTTTLTDDFNRANAGSLGTASGGFTYTDFDGVFTILNNQAECSTASHADRGARADSDLSDTDFYAEITANQLQGTYRGYGAIVRCSDSAETMYVGWYYGLGNAFFISEITAGSRANLSSGGDTKADPVRLDVSGSTLTLTANGVQKVQTTDTTLSSQVRGGFWVTGSNTGATLVDDLEISDGAGGTPTNIAPAVGSTVMIGQDVATNFARAIAPDAGALSMAGQAVVVNARRVISAAAGALSVAGQAVTIKVSHLIEPAAGALSVAGQAVTVNAVQVISVAAGAISVAGQAVTVTLGRLISVSAGAISISGQALTLLKARLINVGAGALSISGQTVSVISAGAGSGISAIAAIVRRRRRYFH